eukprot:scaffold302071_cov35-Tisochrysis_lutea.AAC.1
MRLARRLSLRSPVRRSSFSMRAMRLNMRQSSTTSVCATHSSSIAFAPSPDASTTSSSSAPAIRASGVLGRGDGGRPLLPSQPP